ncbi:MAG: hypothetical protein NC902_02655 [Candidatus Omnitrophica bacterium]|nr:hypothetical protein [Candidatus Omnitrophota bacterium]
MKKIVIVLSLIGLVGISGVYLTHTHACAVNSFNTNCSICANLTAFSPFSFQLLIFPTIIFFSFAVSLTEPGLIKNRPFETTLTRSPPV